MLGVKVILYTAAIVFAIIAIAFVLATGITVESDTFTKSIVIICIIASLMLMRDAALIKLK